MHAVISAEQMRAAEQPLLAAGQPLMARAAEAVAREVPRLMLSDGPIVVAVGPGNNGGDGLFAAASLTKHARVLVWLTQETGHDEGTAAAREAGCEFIDAVGAVAALEDASVVIDAVLGLGGRPGLDEPVATFAQACATIGVPVLSVDLPSGLQPDAVAAPVSFHADVTVTFAAQKLCHLASPAADRCGQVVVADIGVPVPETQVWALDEATLSAWWPMPTSVSDKYSRGVVGLDTGSAHYPGAGLLGVGGALYSGAGMVRYLGGASQELIVGSFPSVVTAEGRVQAMVLGSGWGDLDDAAARLAAAVERQVRLVIDADAIGHLDGVALPEGSLLTPHAGELARYLGVERDAVVAEPIEHAKRAAQKAGAAVLLKGGTQYATDGQQVLIAIRGSAWNAQAGSGDTLAGVCGTLLAAGLPAVEAGAMAASLQALTSAGHPGPFPPDQIAAHFPQVIADLTAATHSRAQFV